jgi:hypothetical protein
MRHYDDEPTMYRTFEEFEREELRRADSIGSTVDELFEGMIAEDLDFDAAAARRAPRRQVEVEGDDEE